MPSVATPPLSFGHDHPAISPGFRAAIQATLGTLPMPRLPDRAMLSPLPDPPMTSPPLQLLPFLEPGLLYGLLCYRGETTAWHWAFYVPDPDVLPIGTRGTAFSVERDASTGRWVFRVDSKRGVLAEPMLVAIVALGDLAPLGNYEEVVGQDALLAMLRNVTIPRPGERPFSSKAWFMDAVGVLHDCGVIVCEDVWLLEREMSRCAFSAMDKYMDNRGALSGLGSNYSLTDS